MLKFGILDALILLQKKNWVRFFDS
jgi:hypothetical protein